MCYFELLRLLQFNDQANGRMSVRVLLLMEYKTTGKKFDDHDDGLMRGEREKDKMMRASSC